MKTQISIVMSFFCMLAAQLPAQDSENQYEQRQYESKLELELRSRNLPPDGAIFRSVNGQTYNILYAKTWQVIRGQVQIESGDIIIIEDRAFEDVTEQSLPSFEQHPVYYALQHYSANPTAGTTIGVVALRIGNYDWNGTPIEFYDCGLPSSPPPQTPEQIAASKRQAVLEQERIMESQTNAFRWLLLKSTNGSASDQYDLALHYLNGQGCETNRQQAIFWLKESASQDGVEASNKLASLNAKPTQAASPNP